MRVLTWGFAGRANRYEQKFIIDYVTKDEGVSHLAAFAGAVARVSV